MKNRPVVFFDLDGVLADFVGGALRYHGAKLPAKDIGWDFWQQIGLSAKAFWEPLGNADFWANLNPLPDGMELFAKTLKSFDQDQIGFLSSPLCPGSADGKHRWLEKHIGGWAKKAVVLTADKFKVASPHKLLIDDSSLNLEPFEQAGGQAILIPRPWNARRWACLGEDCHFEPEALFDEVAATLEALEDLS